MSKVTVHKCDCCGLIVEDCSKRKGWIQLGSINVSVSGGPYKNAHIASITGRDFCSRKCLDKTWFAVGKIK